MIRSTILLAVMFVGFAHAGPDAHNIETLGVSPSQLYITDTQDNTWILESDCEYKVNADSKVKVRYGSDQVRTGKRLVVTIDGNTEICRITDIQPG